MFVVSPGASTLSGGPHHRLLRRWATTTCPPSSNARRLEGFPWCGNILPLLVIHILQKRPIIKYAERGNTRRQGQEKARRVSVCQRATRLNSAARRNRYAALVRGTPLHRAAAKENTHGGSVTVRTSPHVAVIGNKMCGRSSACRVYLHNQMIWERNTYGTAVCTHPTAGSGRDRNSLHGAAEGYNKRLSHHCKSVEET